MKRKNPPKTWAAMLRAPATSWASRKDVGKSLVGDHENGGQETTRAIMRHADRHFNFRDVCSQTPHLVGRGRIDNRFDFGDPVGRKASLLRMLPNDLFTGSDIHAVELVGGDVTLHPLDFGAKRAQYLAGSLRNALQLSRRQIPGSRQVAFDDVLGQGGVLKDRDGRSASAGGRARVLAAGCQRWPGRISFCRQSE